MKNNFKILLVFVLVVFFVFFIKASAVASEKLKGSAEVLRLLRDEKSTVKKEKNKADSLLDDLDQFKKDRYVLAPDMAAKKWLDLYDRFQNLTPQDKEGNSFIYYYRLKLSGILESIPPPESWGILADLVKKRNGVIGANREEVGLAVLTQFLSGNTQAARAALSQFTPFLDKMNAVSRPLSSKALAELRRLLSGKEETPVQQIAEFEKALDSGLVNEASQNLQIPNLVETVGKEKASLILRKALSLKGASYELPSGDATRGLAKKIALELASTLFTLPWNFVDEIHDTALYEALALRSKTLQKRELSEREKKTLGLYDYKEGKDTRNVAGMVYALGLIAAGKPEKALGTLQGLSLTKKGIVEIPKDAILAMDRVGYSSQLFDFLQKYLDKEPSSPLWKQYVPLAIRVGQSSTLIEQIGRLQLNTNVPDLIRMDLQSHLLDAYLADNQLDKALPLFRVLLKKNTASMTGESLKTIQKLQWNSAMRMAAIGFFNGNHGLEDEGFSWLSKNSLLEPQTSYEDYASYREETSEDAATKLPSYSELLIRANRYQEAEDYYLSRIKKIMAADQSSAKLGGNWGNDPFSGLILLYDKAGRSNDVLELLSQNPYWNTKDLIGLTSKVQKAVGVALTVKGRQAEGVEIIKYAILQDPSEDENYQALLGSSAEDLTKWLSLISEENRFEKRPLIWKSKVQFNQGKLEEAEKTVREAIRIDPSDGEAGKGDRMRAYAILAEILTKRGNKEEAKTCLKVVSAIRMSENADDFLSAGLVKKAIDQYGKSLEVFASAYCIQSRMAIRLHDLGNFKEAEKHYEKAYELMPDSFGRVESHCFGCERVFEGQEAESTAERVFKRLCQERPKSPQVHYLLGYLRITQRRWNEARDSFWDAVKLDPDYLNAWNKLEEVSTYVSFTDAQKSLIGLNLLRLNPACLTSSQLISAIKPIEGWNTLRESQKRQLERPEKLLDLKASADRLEELKKLGQETLDYTSYYRDRRFVNPAMAVVQNAVTKNVIQLMTGKEEYSY